MYVINHSLINIITDRPCKVKNSPDNFPSIFKFKSNDSYLQANLESYEGLQRQQLEQHNMSNRDGMSEPHGCEHADAATVEQSVLEDAGSSGTQCTPNNGVVNPEESWL